jgi:hypothetical protein
MLFKWNSRIPAYQLAEYQNTSVSERSSKLKAQGSKLKPLRMNVGKIVISLIPLYADLPR